MELGMFVTWTIQMVMGAASPVFITWTRTGTPRWVSHWVEAEQEGKTSLETELQSCPLFLWTLVNSEVLVHSSSFSFPLGVFGNALEVRIWTVSLSSSLPFYTHTVVLLQNKATSTGLYALNTLFRGNSGKRKSIHYRISGFWEQSKMTAQICDFIILDTSG